MAKEVLLSLALIMRDAEQEILTCLASVAEAVDEMVIVDTGSRDGSVKLVRKFLRKWQGEAAGRQGKLYEFAWRDDFALAKNYALSRCHGAYVLFLDSDESLSEGTRGNLRALVEKLAAGGLPEAVKPVRIPGASAERCALPFDIFELWRKNTDLEGNPVPDRQDDLAVRLLRRQERLRYRGEVHEQLVFTDGRPAQAAAVGKELLTILHTGYRPGLKELKDQRNHEILLKEERQGGSTFLLDYYLAEMHLSRREWQQALERALRCLATTRPVHDSIAPYRISYQALRELEGEALQRAGLELAEGEELPRESEDENEHLRAARKWRRQGEEIMEKALQDYPDYPDFYYFRGGRKWNLGDKEGGSADLEKALALAESFPRNHPESDFRFRELLPGLLAALEQVRAELREEKV